MKWCMPALAACVALLSPVSSGAAEAGPASEVVVADARFPTNMAFSPDGRLFYVEKDSGDVRLVDHGRLQGQPFAHIDVTAGGETGLLGIAIPPDFARDPWVYVYASDAETGHNEIVRIRADGNVGREIQPVLTALPTENGYHNGGDIAFGPDDMLYVTVGEVHESDRAQDPTDLGGKVLRITPTGASPEDNPFGQTPVFSMGHRNSFGICFAPDGQLYETENGPDSHDEVNRVVAGGNYGWPAVMGPSGGSRYIDPIWDFPQVVVPTGCAVLSKTLYWGDYSEGRIYALSLDRAVDGADAVMVGDLGVGVTDLQVGPDGGLYVATASSILRFASPPGSGTLPALSPGASPAPALRRSNHFETYAAWATGALALLIVILGGLWFRRLSRRESSTPDA